MAPKRKATLPKSKSPSPTPKRPSRRKIIINESDDEKTHDVQPSPSFQESISKPQSEDVSHADSDMQEDDDATISTKRGKQKRSLKFLVGCRVDMEWVTPNWPEFSHIIAKQKWAKLVDIHANEGLYEKEMEDITRVFDVKNDMAILLINGQIHTFSEKDLSKWLDVPNLGFDELVGGKDRVNLKGKKNGDIVKFFGGNPKLNSVPQDVLSPFHKMIFQFVKRFLHPRPQKRGIANLLDLCLMYCLIHYMPINFPSLFLKQVAHTVKNKNVLGYGNIFTKIFKCLNIPLAPQPTFPLKKEDILDEGMVERHGLCMDDGEVITKEEKIRRELVRTSASGSAEPTAFNENLASGSADPTRAKGKAPMESVPTKQPSMDWVLLTSGGTVGRELKQLQDLVRSAIVKLEDMDGRICRLDEKLASVKADLINNIRLNRLQLEEQIEKTASHFVRSG